MFYYTIENVCGVCGTFGAPILSGHLQFIFQIQVLFGICYWMHTRLIPIEAGFPL